jgi:uncharacterized protein (DUF924 family)
MPDGVGHHLADSQIQRVIGFWRAAGPARWFAKNPLFDSTFGDRFSREHFAAAARRHDDWAEEPSGSLALVILLDQYPRNAFRGTAHMYATDPLGRLFALEAVDAGFDREVDPRLRRFFYLPFMHSEALSDQERSVELHARLGKRALDRARRHRDIIRRFGRFPHRNSLLGRQTTAAELAFLDAGGFAG